ncbi:hypothetical protein BJX65DRAFT_286260 [Aspergillus insuetus]
MRVSILSAALSGLLASALPTNEAEGISLAKRTDFSGSNVRCYPEDYWEASRETIAEGIAYLRGVSGQPSAGPGPGACARVSCSYASAIWWCNDDPAGKTLDSFSSIADGAQYIYDNCHTGGYDGVLSGQVFHSTDWNVIVKREAC